MIGAALLIKIDIPVKQEGCAVIDITDVLMSIAQGVRVDVTAR